MNDPKDIDAGSWLPGLIGPLEIRNAGVAVPKRQALNFVGATITDDAVNGETDIAFAGASDATSGAKGIVQLAGDLNGSGGTAAAPRVSGITGAVTTGKVTHNELFHELLSANQRLRDERFEAALTTGPDLLWSLTMPTGESWVVDFELVAHGGGVNSTNLYRATRKIKNVAGALTVTTIGTDVSSEDAVGTIDYTVSGTTVRLRYTKPAGTWRCVGRVTIDGAVA